MGEPQQFDNSSGANAIKNICQCKFKQRSSFFHQGNGIGTLKQGNLFMSPPFNAKHLKERSMCLVETISEHLARLCHLSVEEAASVNINMKCRKTIPLCSLEMDFYQS